MNERYKLDMSFHQTCFGMYNGTRVETMHKCSRFNTASYLPVTAATTFDTCTNLDRSNTEVVCSNSTNIISILKCYPLRAYPHPKSANKYLRSYMLHKPRTACHVLSI